MKAFATRMPPEEAAPATGQVFHVSWPSVTFWHVDARGRTLEGRCSMFGEQFRLWAIGTPGAVYEGYWYVSDARGQTGILPAAALTAGPALHRVVVTPGS